MKRITLIVLCIIFVNLLSALGILRVESIKELPATHTNLEVYDADGKYAPVLIIKTELQGVGIQNIGRPTKHAAEYNSGKHEYKFYMNDNQRVVEITHADYEPLEVRLLADFGINVKAQRVYELVLTNVPEKLFVIVNILSEPSDAEKIVDGKNLGTGKTFKLFTGDHSLRVQKEGYNSQVKKITVSESSMLFEDIELKEIDIVAVQIGSIPQGATIYIDNQEQGITDKGIFIYPGTYELKLTKIDFLNIDEQITIVENQKNIFTYDLIKNSGIINFSITPADAIMKLNGEIYNERNPELKPGVYNAEISKSGYLSKSEVINLKLGEKKNKQFILQKNMGTLELEIAPSDAEILINKTTYGGTTNIELSPGKYKIEVQKQGYFPQSEMIDIELDHTISRTFSLEQMKGRLQFNITPLTAKIEMKIDGKIYQEWTGMKILKDVPVGEYEIVGKANGFKTKTKKVIIELNKTNTIDLVMEEGSDILEIENMIFVKGGTFMMGSNESDNEKPIHSVMVDDFYVGKYEVTQQEWKDVMGNNPSKIKDDNLPVEQISWYDVVEFCNKKSKKEGLQKCYSGSGKNITCNFIANGYRLPREAEWEFAARGGNKSNDYKYSGSNTIDDVAWYNSNSVSKMHQVGSKQANELGIYDMSGNVYEWCNDWYASSYYNNSSKDNLQGPSSGSTRVFRGGGWYNPADYCRVTYRYFNFPGSSRSDTGFRLVRSPE